MPGILISERMSINDGSGIALTCSSAAGADNGLGDWLPVLACLKSQLGFSLAEARTLPVAQAFALEGARSMLVRTVDLLRR